MISELGCGTGVVGLSAAALGGEVILTDLPVYIPAVQENIQANTHRHTGRVTAAALDWKQEVPSSLRDIMSISSNVTCYMFRGCQYHPLIFRAGLTRRNGTISSSSCLLVQI